MSSDSALLLNVSNAMARKLLDLVASKKMLRSKELWQRVQEEEPTVDASELEDALIQLKRRDLIKDTGTQIEDFNTYYITAKGLEVNRQVKRAVRH